MKCHFSDLFYVLNQFNPTTIFHAIKNKHENYNSMAVIECNSRHITLTQKRINFSVELFCFSCSLVLAAQRATSV